MEKENTTLWCLQPTLSRDYRHPGDLWCFAPEITLPNPLQNFSACMYKSTQEICNTATKKRFAAWRWYILFFTHWMYLLRPGSPSASPKLMQPYPLRKWVPYTQQQFLNPTAISCTHNQVTVSAHAGCIHNFHLVDLSTPQTLTGYFQLPGAAGKHLLRLQSRGCNTKRQSDLPRTTGDSLRERRGSTQDLPCAQSSDDCFILHVMNRTEQRWPSSMSTKPVWP